MTIFAIEGACDAKLDIATEFMLFLPILFYLPYSKVEKAN